MADRCGGPREAATPMVGSILFIGLTWEEVPVGVGLDSLEERPDSIDALMASTPFGIRRSLRFTSSSSAFSTVQAASTTSSSARTARPQRRVRLPS